MSGTGRDVHTTPYRIAGVTLDEKSIVRRGAEVEQEKKIAIYDLLAGNSFAPNGSPGGPYRLILGIAEGRLVFDLRLQDDSEHAKVILSLTPFVRVLKEYRTVCDSYYAAMRDAPARIEAIDMGRRGLHDEGAALLIERLDGKIAMDTPTARRLFTLICALSAGPNPISR
jgi:uncharacterized protein (UPF0262 family)